MFPPDLKTGRYGHACGLLRDESGSPIKVVVASGYGSYGLLSETEILDLQTGIWTQGPPIAAYAAGKWKTNSIGAQLFNWPFCNTVEYAVYVLPYRQQCWIGLCSIDSYFGNHKESNCALGSFVQKNAY